MQFQWTKRMKKQFSFQVFSLEVKFLYETQAKHFFLFQSKKKIDILQYRSFVK